MGARYYCLIQKDNTQPKELYRFRYKSYCFTTKSYLSLLISRSNYGYLDSFSNITNLDKFVFAKLFDSKNIYYSISTATAESVSDTN